MMHADPIQILDHILSLIEEDDFEEARDAARLARLALPPGSKLPEPRLKPGFYMRDDRNKLLVHFERDGDIPHGWVEHYDSVGGDWYQETVETWPDYELVTVQEVERRFGKIK